jgi:hypothetical protein
MRVTLAFRGRFRQPLPRTARCSSAHAFCAPAGRRSKAILHVVAEGARNGSALPLSPLSGLGGPSPLHDTAFEEELALPPIPRRWRTALTAAMLGTAAIATSADARVISVAPNHNVTVFQGIDFIAAFGAAPGVSTTVQVRRSGQLIGTSTGPAADLAGFDPPNNGGLEVNHGPLGAPVAGDCWTGFTPDIIPGDMVTVTRGAAVDQVEVDNITIDDGPFVDSAGNVVLRGTAALFDGTPIPIAQLDSGEVRNTSRFRGGPTSVFRTPGTAAGWTMVYDVSRPMDTREPAGLTPAQRRDLIMAGAHAQGFGHAIVPPPAEIQVADGADTPGPALGCEGSPSESNAVAALDDKAVNIASADLVVNGSAMAATVDNDITSVVPKVSDGTTTLTGAPVNVTGAVRTWAATFTRAQLDTLADKDLTVSADYVTAAGPIGGKSIKLAKDVVAPDVTADRDSGDYTGPVKVTLKAAAGDTITYRTDGLDNGAGDRTYSEPIDLAFGATKLNVRVTDAAGNVTDKSFTYTVNRPVAAAAPVVIPPVIKSIALSKLQVERLTLTKRIALRSARRSGINAVLYAPDGAKVARIRVLRRKRIIQTITRTISRDGVIEVRLPTGKKTRRALRRGVYTIEIRVGQSAANLGPAVIKTVRVR